MPARVSPEDLAELFRRSRGAEYGLSLEGFARVLRQVQDKYLPAEATARAAVEFCQSLKLEDLALARGCAAGDSKAWEVFLVRYRECLYGAARTMTRDDASARELADSLYADLYGTRTKDGVRISKLNYFMGRGSLEGWLRTVLAQEHVNRHRQRRRLVSFEEEEERGAQFPACPEQDTAAVDPRLASASERALAELQAEDRMVLAAYYLDGRTLAEVGRMLGAHESTISRRVEKLVRRLRKRLVEHLRAQGMSQRQAQEALEADVRDLRVDVRRSLAQECGDPAFLHLRKEKSE